VIAPERRAPVGERVAERIPPSVAWTWSIGSLGSQAMLTSLPYFVLFYMVRIMGLEPATGGILLFLGKILDIVSYPAIGMLSDRTTGKLGRRRPYLLVGAVLSGVSSFALFNAPASLHGWGANVYACIAMTGYALGLASFWVPYLAMPAEMTDDDTERTKLLGLRSYFTLFGIFCGGPIAGYLVHYFGDGRGAYQVMGEALGLFVALSMLVTFFGARRARATSSSAGAPLGLIRIARRFASNRMLMSMGLVHFLQTFAGATTQAVLLFFFAIVMGKGTEALTLFGGVIMLSGLVCIPIWVRLGRRFGNLPCYLAGMWVYTAACFSWIFAGPNEPTWIFVVRAAIAGLGSTATMVCGQAVLVNAIRGDSIASGDPREGVMSSGITLFEKIATALGPLVVGLLLSAAHFDKSKTDITDQPASAIAAIDGALVWTAVGTMVVIQILFWKFRILDKRARSPTPVVVSAEGNR
jgi:Na+/melibiose symporter-like transporter